MDLLWTQPRKILYPPAVWYQGLVAQRAMQGKYFSKLIQNFPFLSFHLHVDIWNLSSLILVLVFRPCCLIGSLLIWIDSGRNRTDVYLGTAVVSSIASSVEHLLQFPFVDWGSLTDLYHALVDARPQLAPFGAEGRSSFLFWPSLD